MNRIAKRTKVAVIIGLLLVAGWVFFLCEYFLMAKQWVVFPGSPHVYNGSNIGCGVITDREGVLLLDTNDGRSYSSDGVVRKATVHWVGDRYGSIDAPALSNYSTQLVGYDFLNGVYHYGDDGGVAKLTLSARVQAVALEAMGNYKGTVAVYNYKTGQLLCSVTTPTYDPDNVPAIDGDGTGQYEGLYWNRFTQTAYIPGSIFKIVTLAAALEEMPEIVNDTFVCSGVYRFGNDEITCEGMHFDQTLQEAFRNSCNCAFAQIAERLGPQKLQEYVEKFGVTDSISFDGVHTAAGSFQVADAMDANVAWSAIGQHKDQINPCAFMTFVGAIANGGKGVNPNLVMKVSVGDSSTYQSGTVKRERIMSEETAEILCRYMRLNVEEKYGASNFPGLTVCAKTGTGEVGGDKKPNAMLAGFVSDEDYPLAFVVCVEDGGYGRAVCIPIASKVLAACKSVLDSE